MPKRSTSQNVPKEMQARFDEITQITDTFSDAYLNNEYKDMCRQVTATLCRKRLSPLLQGKANTWACAIIHAVGTVNFLFDSSQKPYVPARELASHFGISRSTMQAKSKQIRDLLNMYQFAPDWTIPSMVEENPLIWMVQVNGLIVDVRHMPRHIQEEALRKD